MDRESEQTAKVLSVLIETTHRLFLMAETLSARPEIAKVAKDFEWSKNHSYWEFGVGSPYLLDWYVDAELATGKSLVWILELHWPEEKWSIESRVETTAENGLEVLKEFPSREAQTVDELISQLQAATSELIDSCGSRDFES